MRKGKIIFVILILLTFIITITACNKPKQFTIKFEVDGEVVYSITVDKDTTISAPTSPTKEGYNFGGWYFDKDTLQSPLTTNFNVEDNKNKEIKLYAKWTAKEVQTTIYAITYCNIKDCVNNNKTTFALTDEAIILENLPNIKGYKFVEWQDETGNVVTTISAQTVTQESARSADCLSLNAVWLAEQYSVSYSNLEGATHTNLSEYNVESEAFLLSDPSKRTGYFFKEWQDENGKKVTKINPLEATNLKLNAVWEVATYNIDYFNENGAVNSNPKMFKHNNKQINLAALECDGYDFLGWFDAEIGGKKIDNIDENSEGNKQFYAHWEAKKYNLTLDNGTIKTVTYKQNYALGIAQEKTGYAFLGWFTAVDCGGEQLTDNVGNSLTAWDKPQYMQLYSGYKAIKYTITFVTDFGSEIAPKQLCYKDTLNLGNCVTVKNACNFLGWFLDVNDVNKFEETTMPARNLTLYAKWKQ
ncbi:MAG: InlB B-repeat-containing protein, partial [Clostridia bacterium]